MVKICVRESKSMGTNCYVVSDGEKYIVIDPAVDFDTMDDLCDGEIAAVLITHGHFDHVEKLQSYLDNTNAKIYGQKNCLDKLQNPLLNCSGYFGDDLLFNCDDRFIAVNDGDKLKLLKEEIKVLENFGHTNCSVSFVIQNNIFCGDFVFAGSIGRTDLPTASIIQMKKSIKNIKSFMDDYTLYPGHGTKTTLEIEKNRNPYFNV